MRLRRLFDRRPRPGRVMLDTRGRGASSAWGAGFGWLHDVSPAAWIGPRLHPFARDVGSIVPEGFPAYARLFHPIQIDRDRTERWSDVARRNGRIVHPEMQFHLISVPQGETPTEKHRGHHPMEGTLSLEQRRVLVDHLRVGTTTPDRCWFAMWEGFGGLNDGGIRERVQLPNRNYLLYAGAIDRALESPDPFMDHSPNLWWPEDRAWFVATEIDLAWTYVAGDQSLIGRLTSDNRLEVLPVALGAAADYKTDRPNAATP
jgi:hypothetical protein